MSNKKRTPSLPKLRFPEFQNSSEWSVTAVGRISNAIIAGGTPSTSDDRLWGGDIRWMNSGELNFKRVYEVQGRITSLGLKNSSTKKIPPRCVLIGLAGQGKTRGTVAMNMVSLCTNQSIAAIFPNESTFNSDFLYHDLDKRYEELRRLSASGEGRGGLNLQIIKSLGVHLPQLSEQKKIADCLSSLDELITAQALKADALKTHKEGLMQRLFPRKGEIQPRLRFPEFCGSPNWKEVAAGDVFLNRVERGNSSLPIYSVTMTDGMVPRTSLDRRINDIAKASANKTVRKGDIAYNMMRMWQGAMGVAPEDCMVSPAYIVLKAKEANTVFFSYLLKQPQMLQLLTARSRGLTEDRLRLYYEDFAKIPLLCPSVDEQDLIAGFLSSLDRVIAVEAREIDALKAHKKGLFQQLFPSAPAIEA